MASRAARLMAPFTSQLSGSRRHLTRPSVFETYMRSTLRALGRGYATNAAEPGPGEGDESARSVRTGWVFKGLMVASITYIALNSTTLMGDSLVRQSVALLKAKDPFLQRSGATRLHLIATDDGRRSRIVEAGAVGLLSNLAASSPNAATTREATKALARLVESGEAAAAMQEAGVGKVLHVLATSSADQDTQVLAQEALQKLLDWEAKGAKEV